MNILEAETFSTCRWYSESRILYEKPSLRRSTSRSRNAVSTPSTPSSSKKMSKAKSPSKSSSSRKPSKSPGRGRPAAANKKTPRVASKSATPRTASRTPKSPTSRAASRTPRSQPASASRSRSRSRARTTTASTPTSSAASSSTPRSTSRSRSTTHTPRSAPRVVKTAEVADDDEAPSPPVLRQRTPRNLTQDPPTSAQRLSRQGVSRVFSTSRSPAKPKSGCMDELKGNCLYVKQKVGGVLNLIYQFFYWLITSPFISLRDTWRANRPKNDYLAASLFFVICLGTTALFLLMFPHFALRMYRSAQKNIVAPFNYYQREFVLKVSDISENVHKWSYAKWKAMTEKWNNKATQTP
ncbi:hypothetical protein CRE_28455 [Caenorhabditis remanei]|uniref:Uncharacterized protein n=1 Tax=Caenorhabditis remanei TaxID=31234 RepID=E3LMI8_CAERE|nr:hypothetical protein CRE_28455 [Caenorhabditis remanei]